jgi:hypothetical protein
MAVTVFKRGESVDGVFFAMLSINVAVAPCSCKHKYEVSLISLDIGCYSAGLVSIFDRSGVKVDEVTLGMSTPILSMEWDKEGEV